MNSFSILIHLTPSTNQALIQEPYILQSFPGDPFSLRSQQESH